MKIKKVNPRELNKQEVIQFVSDIYEYVIKVISKVEDSSLEKEFNWNGGKLNKYQFLNLIKDHQAHHVGQLIVYFRLNAIEPPKYIGW